MKYTDEDLIERLKEHRGHDIAIVIYGKGTDGWNIALKCEDCVSVILDYDLDEEGNPIVE